MLRVLTLSTLFPNGSQPAFGVFVERQTAGLAALPGIELEVVAPIGLPPWPLTLHPHYRPRAQLPREEEWKSLAVHRPHFRVWPGLGQAAAARSMAHSLLPKLREIRQRFPFEMIDAEFFWPDGPAAMHLARALGVPFSIKARGGDIQYWGKQPAILPQLRDAAQAAAGLLAVSTALKEDMIALGMPGEKIAVHYTGIDKGKFVPRDRTAAKASLGLSGPLIVTAGALIPRKAQALAIQAVERLPDATLVLVGEGPDRSRLEALAAPLGDRVRFLGSRFHEELPALMAAADVTVLASESEGLANVWVESLACGTPIVISDVGGARELLDRPEAGRIVARDPEAIANAISAILEAPPDQLAVRAAAERFSWERNAHQLRDHLAGLVKAA